jgi:hypothetical protein
LNANTNTLVDQNISNSEHDSLQDITLVGSKRSLDSYYLDPEADSRPRKRSRFIYDDDSVTLVPNETDDDTSNDIFHLPSPIRGRVSKHLAPDTKIRKPTASVSLPSANDRGRELSKHIKGFRLPSLLTGDVKPSPYVSPLPSNPCVSTTVHVKRKSYNELLKFVQRQITNPDVPISIASLLEVTDKAPPTNAVLFVPRGEYMGEKFYCAKK